MMFAFRSLLFLAFASCFPAVAPSPTRVSPRLLPQLSPAACGPEILGFAGVVGAPIVMLGEVHGMEGPPAFAVDFACRAAQANGGAVLALEIPKEEQSRIDGYLRSDGTATAREELLDGPFWRRPFQAGRSSVAMLGLLETSRRLLGGGLRLRIAAIDDDSVKGQGPRERAMAESLLALLRAKQGTVVMLVGNYHAHTRPGAPWDPTLRLMGAIVKEAVPSAIGLDVRYGPGEMWVCRSAEATECGRSPTKGSEANPWTIDRFPALDAGGFAGTFGVGAAVASEPARGLPPAMQVASVVRRFREENKAAFVDGMPSESRMGADDRRLWCERLVTLARSRLALDGDVVGEAEACAVTLVPAASRQVVPGVQVRLDVGYFFRKPYAAASYDRETRTLYLPLAALVRPWDEIDATRHEWHHARIHARARSGDALATALQSIATGPDYRPDGFYVDEIPANLCDVVRAAKRGEGTSDKTKMIDGYLGYLRKELDATKASPKKAASSRAGVPGVTLVSSDGVERWVGGADARRSLTLLESVWKDATTTLSNLRATPSVLPSVPMCE